MADTRPSILIQLDTDPQPSVFDGVVAVDAGVDHLFRHGGVKPESVRDLVHGALFTRGGADLGRTAIFIGGSNVAASEAVFRAVRATFFAGFRVSVLFDANGCNTTAAAAAVTVLRQVEGTSGTIEGTRVAVLGGTGPVGERTARLLAGLGATVALGSRDLDRARATADRVREATGRTVTPFATSDPEALGDAEGVRDAEVIISAGAAGVTLLPVPVRKRLAALRVMIDLNAVPPAGIEGAAATDSKTDRDGVLSWGALGVGGTKMKIHKQTIRELFAANDRILDAEAVLALGRALA